MKKSIHTKVLDEIYQEIDGFYVFGTSKGFISANHLREIADVLDMLNGEHEKQINDHFKNGEKNLKKSIN